MSKNKLVILGLFPVALVAAIMVIALAVQKGNEADETPALTLNEPVSGGEEVETTISAPAVVEMNLSDPDLFDEIPDRAVITPDEYKKFAGKRIKDAEALIKERRFDEAMELLDYQIRVFGRPRNRARAQVLLGQLMVGRGHMDEALALFVAAVESDSLPPEEAFNAHLDVMRTLAKLALFDDVAEWIQKIEAKFFVEGQTIEWFNANAARFNLARSLFNLGLSDYALEQAVKISGPESKVARQASLIEVRSLIAMGRNEEARAAIMKGIGENGGEPYEEVSKLYYEIVRMAMRDGNTALALEWALKGQSIFENSKRFDDYMYHMATYLRKEGVAGWEQFSMALAAREEGKRKVDALEQLAASAIRNNRWEEAERYYQELVMIPNRDGVKTASDYLRLLEAQQKLGKPTHQVVNSLMAFLETNPDADPAGLHRLGKGLLEVGYSREAVAYFEHLVKNTAGDARERAMLLLGDAHAASGSFAMAMANYKDVIDIMAAQGRYEMVAQTMYRMAEKTNGLQTEEGRRRVLAEVEKLLPNIETPYELIRLLDYFGARQQREIQLVLLDHAHQAALKQFDERNINWHEQVKVIQNLYAFRHHDEALALIEKIQTPRVGQPAPTTHAIQEAQFYDALITLDRGDKSSFTQKADQLLADGRVDRVDRAKFALSFGEELYFNNDYDSSLQYFRASVSSAPGSTHAMQSRIYLGAEALKNGDTDAALQHASAIVNGMSPRDRISLNRGIYWGGVALLEITKKRHGDGYDPNKYNEAIDKANWYPLIRIVNGSS